MISGSGSPYTCPQPGELCSLSYTCQSCEIHCSVVDEAGWVLKHWSLLHPTQRDSYLDKQDIKSKTIIYFRK